MKNRFELNLSGLSLVEIIVAVVILSLVLSGFVNLFISSKGFIIHSRSRMTAGELGKYFLDPLSLHVRQDTWNQPPPTNNLSNSSYSGDSVVIDKINYTSNYTVTNVTVGLSQVRKVKLNITWNESLP